MGSRFLDSEGVMGDQAEEAIDELQGSLFENLTAAKTLKQIKTDPRIFSLRIPCMDTS